MIRSDTDIEVYDAPPAPPAAAPSPWQFIQDRMYGRWRYAVPLAILLALAGTAVGYLLAPSKFVAKGLVRVEPTVERVLSPTPEVMPAYDAFVETQVQTLRMDQVLQRAVDRARHDGEGPEREIAFSNLGAVRDALDVTRDRGSTYIQVSIEADDPQAAKWMVESILEEYKDQVAPELAYQRRLDQIEELIRGRNNELRNQENQRSDPTRLASNPYAAHSDEILQSLFSSELDMLGARVQFLTELGVSISMADFLDDEPIEFPSLEQPAKQGPEDGVATTDLDGTEAEVVEIPEPTIADLETLSPRLNQYRRSLDDLKYRLEELKLLYHDQHQEVRRTRTSIEAAEQHVADLERTAREQWYAMHSAQPGELAAAPVTPGTTSVGITGPNINSIISEGRKRGANVLLMNKEVQRRQRIDSEIAKIERSLEGLESSLSYLQDNRQTFEQGRTSVTLPLTPTAPEKSKRRQMAIAGFMGGFGLPFAVFLLIGHIDRRAFASSQVTSTEEAFECIGVLPDLSKLQQSEETRALAEACVHRLRNRLALGRGNDSHSVFAVSSPFQGDGKTSIAFALAWSYAASGYRTVLVDTDFVGQTLTAQAGRLDEPGFRELLRGERPNGEVKYLPGEAPLAVIGVGRDHKLGPESVTKANVRTLLAHLREQFEITILDTGPLLGSVEALPIVSAADGVLLTLRRGRLKRRLDECAKELDAVGGRLLGVVLNCAERSECQRYTSTSRTSMSMSRQEQGLDPGSDQPPTSAMINLLRNGRRRSAPTDTEVQS